MSTQDITLQLAGQHDAALLAAMSRDLIEAGLGWRYRAESIGKLIEDAEMVTLVARSGEALAGFGIMKIGDERAHLILLAVRPEFQRRGIGQRIVHWLQESAAIAGVVSIHVELRAGNTAAYAFYRGLGFAETLRLPGYYSGRETAIRMLRLLRVS
ncbi:MAG: GNAT family N-acetyltransferase [Betaproteobacteria bacterium]